MYVCLTFGTTDRRGRETAKDYIRANSLRIVLSNSNGDNCYQYLAISIPPTGDPYQGENFPQVMNRWQAIGLGTFGRPQPQLASLLALASAGCSEAECYILLGQFSRQKVKEVAAKADAKICQDHYTPFGNEPIP